MKTLEQASLEYANKYVSGCRDVYPANQGEFIDAFEAGVEFSQRWIPVGEELPKVDEKGYSKNVLICDDQEDEEDARIGYLRPSHLIGESVWDSNERPAYWRPINLE